MDNRHSQRGQHVHGSHVTGECSSSTVEVLPIPTAANRVRLGPRCQNELIWVWQKACPLQDVLQQTSAAVQLLNKWLFSLAKYIITELTRETMRDLMKLLFANQQMRKLSIKINSIFRNLVVI